jgi:hypothetical protein
VEVVGGIGHDDQGLTDIVDAGVLPNRLVGLSRIRPRTFGVAVGARW